MSRLVCKICNKQVQYHKNDTEFYENYLQGECPDCFSIIAKQRYKVNIKGSLTLFFGMRTFALGDTIVRQVIENEYLKDNPDEEIIFMDSVDGAFSDIKEFYQKLYKKKIGKIFWANRFAGEIDKPKGAMWFSISSESDWFAKDGKFTRVNFKEKVPEKYLRFTSLHRYIIFHVRNLARKQGKGIHKNMTANECYIALKYLSMYQQKGIIDYIFIIGNDSDSKGLDGKTINFLVPNLNIIDLRNDLQLSEILYLMNRSFLFFGKDSGMVHLAAASKIPNILSYGFQSVNWYPKCELNRIVGSFHKVQDYWK